ncbi:hypothetical protein ACPRNU_01180 [Chromobacterium vaccinii]|uniref:hypothetical protein n=1 Tax=Chromobacterium vaccinii TaxID=1108595 RepID=UPI003C7958E1
MQKTIRQRLAYVFVTFCAGIAVWLVLRNLVVAGLAALAAGVSAQAIAAGAGKAVTASAVHLSALLGAAAGSALLWLNLKSRSLAERVTLVGSSFVAAYFGAQAAFELWGLGPGLVGVAGTVSAYLVVAVLDTALSLVRDIPWIKSVLARRAG